MGIEWVTELGQRVVQVTLLLAAPPLAASLLVGVVIGVFQAATQIHELTLTFVPKILLVLLVTSFAAPWMLELLVNFTTGLYAQISVLPR
jgi:flagellar biosynthetic protein FliQ